MSVQKLDNVTDLIKKYDDVFSSHINIIKNISKSVKKQMKEKTSKKMS